MHGMMEGKGKGDGHQFTNTAGRKPRIPEPVLVSKLTYSEQQGPSRARTGPGSIFPKCTWQREPHVFQPIASQLTYVRASAPQPMTAVFMGRKLSLIFDKQSALFLLRQCQSQAWIKEDDDDNHLSYSTVS